MNTIQAIKQIKAPKVPKTSKSKFKSLCMSNKTNGSSLQGYIVTTYSDLFNVFGSPKVYTDDKVNVEWSIQFADGTIATIYDWKEDTIIFTEYQWHIGGFNQSAVTRVTELMDQYKRK